MKYQRKACITLALSVTIDSVMRMKKKQLSTSLFRKIQKQIKENKDD